MSVVDTLRKARARIAAGWCQGSYAQDAEGLSCSSEDPECARVCATASFWGAGASRADERAAHRYVGIAALLPREAGDFYDLTAWNDSRGRTQADVIAAFDKAIAMAEQEAR